MAITIYDIADRARVSIATVSRVLNGHDRVSEATRLRVLRAAEHLGYEPHASAQSLARKQTGVVGAIVPMTASYFFMEVLRGFQDRVDQSPYDLLVYAGRTMGTVDHLLGRALQRGRSDGVLLVSAPIDAERARKLQAGGRPVVLVDNAHEGFASVSVDNRLGGAIAVRHLLDRGHRRIGLVLPDPGTIPAAARLDGYKDALCSAGLRFDERLVVTAEGAQEESGYTRYAGYRGVQTLLERFASRPADRPTAYFFGADVLALGGLRAFREVGLRYPDDVEVVGFDDVDSSAYVGLTTMRQPMAEMGRMGMDLLLQRIADPGAAPVHAVFAPELVVRETTGGPAAAGLA